MATTTITGATDIDDTHLRQDLSNRSFGTTTLLQIGVPGSGTNNARRYITRIATSAIPAGTITALTFDWHYRLNWSGRPSGTGSIYTIKDANAGWVEGVTANPGTDYATWDSTVEGTSTWAGSGGCGTSGTDYDATKVGTFVLPASNTNLDPFDHSITDVSILADWRDSVRSNGGWMLRADDETFGTNNLINVGSNEDGTGPAEFTITYTEGGGGGGGSAAWRSPKSFLYTGSYQLPGLIGKNRDRKKDIKKF